jgi:hypothetical protein
MQNMQNSSLHCFRTNLEHLERYCSITTDDGKKFTERITLVEHEFFEGESAVASLVPKLRHIYVQLQQKHATQDAKTKKNQ